MLSRIEDIPNSYWNKVKVELPKTNNKYMTPRFGVWYPAIYILLKVKLKSKIFKNKSKWYPSGTRQKDIIKLNRDKLKIVYIGYSSNVYQRIKDHRKTKDFDLVRFIRSPNNSFNREYMEAWERKLIYRFKPKYNHQHIETWRYRSPNKLTSSHLNWCEKKKVWYILIYYHIWRLDKKKVVKILYSYDTYNFNDRVKSRWNTRYQSLKGFEDHPQKRLPYGYRQDGSAGGLDWKEIKLSPPKIVDDVYYKENKSPSYLTINLT